MAKQLNLKVRITYPDRTPSVYDSPQQAEKVLTDLAKKQGVKLKLLTAKAIMLRANAYATADRTVPSDGILCEWLDDSTIRYYRAKAARRKGSSWEYTVRDRIKELGFNVTTSRSESKRTDANNIDILDIDGLLPVSIQCKNQKNAPNYNEIRQGCDVADLPFIIAWRCSQPDSYFRKYKNAYSKLPIEKELMMVPADFFYDLLDAYVKQNKIIK